MRGDGLIQPGQKDTSSIVEVCFINVLTIIYGPTKSVTNTCASREETFVNSCGHRYVSILHAFIYRVLLASRSCISFRCHRCRFVMEIIDGTGNLHSVKII